MDWWKKLRGELIDIVEWSQPGPDEMVHRFNRHLNEIKNGAKLIVRPGQAAIFVDGGRLADVFAPGTHTLSTKSLPILSTLQGWKYGFQSPFKAEVYFVATRQFTDLKWGTMNPVMLRDKEFGPIRLRAFGTFAIRCAEPTKLIEQVAGPSAGFSVEGIHEQLRNIIVSRFADLLGESGIPALDMASQYDELGNFLKGRIAPDLAGYGLELTTLLVENVSLPPEVEKALDKRSSMGIVGDLNAYTKFQAAEALGSTGAAGAGGPMAQGVGLGAGIAMGREMAGMLATPAAPAAPPPAPPAPPGVGTAYHVAAGGQTTGPFTIAQLADMASRGTITPSTMLWTAGMPGWQPAATIADVARLIPPPAPPP